jgi:RNA polymerase sigma-70 factor (ECF subfamily)
MVSSPTFSKPAPEFPAHALAAFQTTGSEEAFRTLARHYYPMIFATALRRSDGNRGMAEDAAQLVLIDLARKARGLRPATLGAWLHRHTCFTTSKLLRSERRRQVREQKAAAETTTTTPEGPSALDDLLLGLADTDRRILLLRHVDGQSHDEIARLLGLTPSAAKKRSERALQKLRVLLRDGAAAESRLSAWLVPPVVLAAAPQAEAAATKALAAPATSPVASWFSHPVVGAALGSAAALALFAVPLAGVWNAPAPGAGTSAHSVAAPTAPWKRLPGALPVYSSPASPADAVERLLEIARTRGVENGSQLHAAAVADELPAGWRQEVMLGLAESAPPGLVLTPWFEETMRVLAGRWQPRALPGDLRTVLPLVRDQNGRRALAKACAGFDLPTTLALVEELATDPANARTPEATAILREDFQTGILSAIAETNDGKATLAYYLSLPPVRRSDGTTRVAQQELLSALWNSPELRNSIWASLDTVSSADLPHLLGLLVSRSFDVPEIELPPLARAHLDSQRVFATIPHDAKSDLPMEEVILAWETALSAEHRLAVAASAGLRHSLTYLELARRLGEEKGGGEFDALRVAVIEAGRYSFDQSVPLDRLFAVAGRIQDPHQRFKARQDLLRRCGGEEKAAPYLEKFIPASERTIQHLLLISETRQYPE